MGQDDDLVTSLRHFARQRHRGDADAKKAWRFVFQAENLRAMVRSHGSIESMVAELLSQRVGPARNPLEERYQELTDPMDYPGAPELAKRLRETAAAGGRVWLEGRQGIEIALVGLLRGGGVAEVSRIQPGDQPGSCRPRAPGRRRGFRPLAPARLQGASTAPSARRPRRAPGLCHLRSGDHRSRRGVLRDNRDRGRAGARGTGDRSLQPPSSAAPAPSPPEHGRHMVTRKPICAMLLVSPRCGRSSASS